jgi:hypothetical protein
MKRGNYSKIADFRIVNLLTKAYKNYFNIPKDKNHPYHRYTYLFKVITQPNKNNSNKIRLKTIYKNTLDNLIKVFNQCIQNQKCKLTKSNIFSFLLFVSEICLKKDLGVKYQNYIYDNKNNLEDFEKKITFCFNEAINSIFLCHNAKMPASVISYLPLQDKKNLLKLILLLKFKQFEINSDDLKK